MSNNYKPTEKEIEMIYKIAYLLNSKYSTLFALEEIISEVFISFMDNIKKYKSHPNVDKKAFFYMNAWSHMGNMWKKHLRNPNQKSTISLDESRFFEEENSLLDIMPDKSIPDTPKTIQDREILFTLNQKLFQILSDKEIETYDLQLKGYIFTEIADILNITTKEIDNTLQRIKEKARNVIYYDVPEKEGFSSYSYFAEYYKKNRKKIRKQQQLRYKKKILERIKDEKRKR